MPSPSRFDHRTPSPAWRGPRSVAPLALLLVFVQAAAAQTPAPGSSVQYDPLPPIEVNPGTDPLVQSFTLGDIDRDGELDLVVAEADDDRVAIYWGEGNGEFTEPTFKDTGVSPVAVVVQDVASNFDDGSTDADGIPDIVVAGDGGEIQILLGIDGDRNFEDGQLYEDLDLIDTASLTVADFDRTGPRDIALVDSFGLVGFLCSTEGTYTPCATASFDDGDEAKTILAGDFDNDNFNDVAVLSGSERGVKYLYGNGRGSFVEDGGIQGRPEDSCDDPVAGALIEINGDTTEDIAYVTDTNFGDACTNLLTSRRRNQVSTATETNPFYATDLATADVDGDSFVDIVFTSNGDTSDFVSALLGEGEGIFTSSLVSPLGGTSPTSAQALEIADLGGLDSLPEIVLLKVNDGEPNEIVVMLNTSRAPRNTPTAPGATGTPTVTPTGSLPPTSTPTPTVPTATATATNTPTPIPTVAYSRCDISIGGGSFAAVATGRFDGDQFLDVALSDTASNSVKILTNNATVIDRIRGCAMNFGMSNLTLNVESVALPSAPGALAAIDVEPDGDVDLAVASGNSVIILTNNGGTLTAGAPIAVGNSPRAIVADYPINSTNPRERAPLDLNKDGLPDLVVANGGSAFLSILYGQAGGGFRVVTREIPGNATTLAAGDFNQDGNVDLIAGRGTAAFQLLQTSVDGNNNAVFQSRTFADGETILGVASGFFNGDRLTDLLITRGGAANSGELWLFSNGTFSRGTGSFSIGGTPVGAGVGWFNPADSRFDTVSGNDQSELRFAYGDGAGGFTSPPLDPLNLPARPAAMAVANLDSDSLQDVVTANADGTVSIALSSVAPATPTPTSTPTVTATPTVTMTFTASLTPEETPTETPTVTLTPTLTGTSTRTVTPGPSPTATPTKVGNFLLSGTGCSVDGSGGSGLPWQGLALGAALIVLRRRSARAGLSALALALLLGGRADAQGLPNYVRCEDIDRNTLQTNSGMRVGSAGDVNGDRSQDLILLDPPRVVVELTSQAEFARGSCREGITPKPLDGVANVANASASALALISNGTFLDLVLTTIGSPGLASRFNTDGAGGFVAAVSSEPLDQPSTVAVGQLTADGVPDLAVGDGEKVKVLVQTAQTTGGTTTLIYSVAKTLMLGNDEVTAVRLGNFNADSRTDIATVDGIGRVRIFLQSSAGGDFTESGSFSLGSDVFPVDMQVGDFDGNARPDLAFITVNGQGTDGALQIYLAQPGSTLSFSRSANVDAGTNLVGLGVGDLDGDGDLDAVVADRAPAQVRFFVGDGKGALTAGPAYPTRTMPNGLLLADLDDDSLADIVTSSQDGGLAIFLSSEPAPTATPTETATPTQTGTITGTATQTATESATPTATPTETGTPTFTPTVTFTGTITRTPTPGETNTPGYFQVMGEGCANIGGGGSGGGGLMPMLVLGLLALIRKVATGLRVAAGAPPASGAPRR
jgi:hypothetical protein